MKDYELEFILIVKLKESVSAKNDKEASILGLEQAQVALLPALDSLGGKLLIVEEIKSTELGSSNIKEE